METTMKDKMSCRGAAERPPALVSALAALWERSVRASHDFLTEEEIRRIGGYVPEALRAVPVLVTAETEGKPVGFMGLDGEKLEMLFLEPDSRGQGVGEALFRLGEARYGLRRTTVNEQNPAARSFYERMGMTVRRRTERDEEGGPYPLLYMEK